MYLKNKKGRIVTVTDERGAYLLDPNPVLLNKHGKPKLNEDGDPFPLVKSKDDEGYTKPTAAEIKAHEAEQEEQREQHEDAENMKAAGAQAIAAAALMANRANKPQKPKKVKEKKEEEDDDTGAELEATVRDAEGDAKKYNALDEAGKEMYIGFFGEAPEGAE